VRRQIDVGLAIAGSYLEEGSVSELLMTLSSLRTALRREMTRRNKAGAYLFMLTCPCHVAMLAFVLAGTAIGSWLVAVRAYLYLTFTLLSLLGLWLMIRPDRTSCDDDACRRD
jgi:hypothetical protein